MSPKLSVLVASLSISLVASSVLALVKLGPQVNINEKTELKAASKNFKLSKREREIKAELESMQKRNHKKFEYELRDSLANGVEFQSYLYEVRDGRSKVETAKQLAKHFLYLAARKNWQDLRNTLVNQYSSNSWREFEPYIKNVIDQRTLYVPEKSPAEKVNGGTQHSKELQFKVDDWGIVKVTETGGKLVKLSWTISAKSPHSENQMPAGWESIKIAE